MVPFIVEIHPLTHPCLRHVVTIDSFTPHKGLQFILNQPIDRHLDEFKSTIRIDLACSGAELIVL